MDSTGHANNLAPKPKGGMSANVTAEVDSSCPISHERQATRYLGIDENGLGPMLGPLIVTGVAISAPSRPVDLGTLIGDSKALSSHADATLGEAWARVLLEHLGLPANSPAEIVTSVSQDPKTTLTSLCPSQFEGSEPRQLCWPTVGEHFSATPARMTACTKALEIMLQQDIRPVGLAASILCVRRYNDAIDQKSKLLVDLHEMERLTLTLAQGDLVEAICGKVGGYDRYGPHFGPLGGRLHVAEIESRAVSTYGFPGHGRLHFMRDADASDPLVGLASLVGKYLRELFMGRIVGFLQQNKSDEVIENASGYHDPVTRRLVASSESLRLRLGVPTRCFVRNK